MNNEKELVKISRFLSLVLRHQPDLIGIQLDENGWTDIDALLERSNRHGISIDKEILNQIVATNSKKRFAVNENLDKIRASQGHSVIIELGYKSQQPPDILFHGTSEGSVRSIFETGIEKRSRQHVHLSNDMETAVLVGRRHGKPYVFKVSAGKMHNDNFEFYLSDNNVWLTEHVPPIYLITIHPVNPSLT